MVLNPHQVMCSHYGAEDATQPAALCVQEAMRRFGLRENADPQTYALGIKEVWEVRGLAPFEDSF